LTAVALIPFLVVGLALAVVAAPPLLMMRWLRRRARGAPRPTDAPERRLQPAGHQRHSPRHPVQPTAPEGTR
jgi:hypothetical protein